MTGNVAGMTEPSSSDWNIREESKADLPAIFLVNQQAFGRDDEANLVDALRADGDVCLSLLAERNRQIVGHLLFTRMTIRTTNGTVPALALAPMAVLPEHQRQGIGTDLVRTGLDLCRRRLSASAVIILGHPEFYPRFGFSSALATPLKSPFSGDAWMALELIPGALTNVTGSVQYPAAFGIPSEI